MNIKNLNEPYRYALSTRGTLRDCIDLDTVRALTSYEIITRFSEVCLSVSSDLHDPCTFSGLIG